MIEQRPDEDAHEPEAAKRDRDGREAQRKLDETPPPGTDPLHEGP